MVLPGAEAEGWSQGQVALRASLAAKLTVVLCLIRNENAEEGRAVSVKWRDTVPGIQRTLFSKGLSFIQGKIQDQSQNWSMAPCLWCELGAALIELLWIYVRPNPTRVASHLHLSSARLDPLQDASLALLYRFSSAISSAIINGYL